VSRVIAVVEGQTEQDFVRDILAPWLGTHGVYISARLVGKPGHKGGVGEYERARQDIMLLLRQEQETVVTTLFDYYGMPDSWPGKLQAKTATTTKAEIVEQAMRENIAVILGPSLEIKRFLPYVQMHEFEALLFSKPSTICETLLSPESESKVLSIRSEFSTPEDINDNPMTAPSKRLSGLFRGYRKRLHGLIAAKRMGIDPMLQECPHFSNWLGTLAKLV